MISALGARGRITAAGWKAGSVAEFLELSPEEAALIDIKLSLSKRLRELREKHHMSQAAVAKAIGSSQSRVAKAAAGDSSVQAAAFFVFLAAATGAGVVAANFDAGLTGRNSRLESV